MAKSPIGWFCLLRLRGSASPADRHLVYKKFLSGAAFAPQDRLKRDGIFVLCHLKGRKGEWFRTSLRSLRCMGEPCPIISRSIGNVFCLCGFSWAYAGLILIPADDFHVFWMVLIQVLLSPRVKVLHYPG